MRTIYKYPLPLDDVSVVVMPEGAKVLTAQVQGNGIFIWAIVETENTAHRYEFEIIGTGHPFPGSQIKAQKYIATVQQNGFVWHIFQN
jgi:hypothetical protein